MFYNYCIQNKVNGKIYVGVSSNPYARFSAHLKVARGGKEKYGKGFCYIHAALRKHINNVNEVFEFNVFEAFDTKEEALLNEVYWIAYLKTQNVAVYNLTSGGEKLQGKDNPMYGRRHSKKTRMLMVQNAPDHSGTKNGRARLNQEMVARIISDQRPERTIAKEYGVSRSTINSIKRGINWKDR